MSTKQSFKPSTKKTIDSKIRAKSRLTKDLQIFSNKDVVEYNCLDGTSVAYLVIGVNRDKDGIYSIKVQNIDENGNVGTNKFETTADKVNRIWCQPGDRIKYIKRFGRGAQEVTEDVTGYIKTISNNAGIILFTMELDKGGKMHLTSSHFADMALLDPLPF